MNDEDLRERFAAWARPLHEAVPPPAGVIRRRARRHAARLGAAGASALAAVGVVAAVVIGGLLAPASRGPSGRSCGAASRPVPSATAPCNARHWFPPGYRYLVTIDPYPSKALVKDAATGATVGVIQPPQADTQFRHVAAAPGDHVFVLADEEPVGGQAWFYELRLGRGGRPVSFRQVPGTYTTRSIITGLAVSSDGTRLAVTTESWEPPGPSHVWVFALTGHQAPREWTSTTGVASTPSWAGDSTLAVNWQNSHDTSPSGLRILQVTGSGGRPQSLLGASRLAIPEMKHAGMPQITQDGSTVLWNAAAGGVTRLYEFAAATGRLLRSVPLAGQGSGRHPASCAVLWSGSTGSLLLAQCDHRQETIAGTAVTRVRLAVPIAVSTYIQSRWFAW
jgi:hypothetical protein